MGYFYDMYGLRPPEFIQGVIAGLELYAWWKDGNLYVGADYKTFYEAVKEAIKDLAYDPVEFVIYYYTGEFKERLLKDFKSDDEPCINPNKEKGRT